MAKRILLVEDEERLLEVVRLNLELSDYEVRVAVDGKEALDRFNQERFDLILLDVMLPRMDGFAVCRAIRLQDRKVPILFLTAKNSAQDRVMGLKIGGDDYLVKPFDLEELLLRVQRLLERSTSTNRVGSSELRFGGNKVFYDRHEAMTKSGETIRLSKRECMILRLLSERDGETVSREEMLDLIWGLDVYPSTRTIDNYIVGFRKYFEDDQRDPKHFHSIRSVGYRFVSNPVDRES